MVDDLNLRCAVRKLASIADQAAQCRPEWRNRDANGGKPTTVISQACRLPIRNPTISVPAIAVAITVTPQGMTYVILAARAAAESPHNMIR